MDQKKPQGMMGKRLLAIVALSYVLLYFIYPVKVAQSLTKSISIIESIVPVLLVVLCVMGMINHFLGPKIISRHLGKGSGAKGYALSSFAGILSHGPPYIWYPLLKDMKEHGMTDALLATFIYARAIKIPWLPLMAYYFGLKFVVVISAYTIIFSIMQGLIFEVLERKS